MNAIMIENKIFSLENVREVELLTLTTDFDTDWGYSYVYRIAITYTNDKIAVTPDTDNESIAKEWLNNIFKKMSKES